MLTQLACVCCIMDDLQGALETTVADEATRLDILREAMAWLAKDFDGQRIPSYYITRVHRMLKQRTGLQMPFRELREQCNKAGLAVRQHVAQAVLEIKNDQARMRGLVLWAIAGNHLDFRTVGTGYDLAAEDITAQLSAAVTKGLSINHTPALLALARKGPRVLYLADNVGEIALDTLLVAELQRYGCQVTVAVKGGPITSDAVWEDAQAVGMDQLAPVILTGPDTLGLPLDEMSPAVRAELEQADVVISKGQANYYACSELVHELPANIFCLLRTKCSVAAESLGLDKPRANVCVLLQSRRRSCLALRRDTLGSFRAESPSAPFGAHSMSMASPKLGQSVQCYLHKSAPVPMMYTSMEGIQRAILIVLDSVGAGALPDADQYGDQGSDTLGNTARAVGGLQLPNLQKLGLGNIHSILGVPAEPAPLAAYGRMAELSPAKDTTIGHWEIAGLITAEPFPTYPHGFPQELIAEYERRIGRKVLGNYPASGTVIIEELGVEHLRTGSPIVYTSGDSVFQVAAHEEVIPVPELYRISSIARDMLKGEHNVGRVIARPFVGTPGAFQRTDRRRDFSAPPPGPTLLDHVLEAGQTVWAVGKIEDIFAGQGIQHALHTHDNMDGVDKTLEAMQEAGPGLIFTNLVDFDMRYGHRNNPAGYAAALRAVDERVPELLKAVRSDDVLIFTADHGCDPTTPSTDHSREYVPLLVYGASLQGGVNLGTRATFADVGATIAEWLGVSPPPAGRSFADDVRKKSIRE